MFQKYAFIYTFIISLLLNIIPIKIAIIVCTSNIGITTHKL